MGDMFIGNWDFDNFVANIEYIIFVLLIFIHKQNTVCPPKTF